MLKNLVLFICLSLSFSSYCREIEMCSNCEAKSLSAAVDLAKPFDVIKIKKGIYPTVGVEITVPLTLIGEEGAILDAENKGEIITVHADSVSISYITFRNIGTSFTKDWAAVSTDKVKYLRFEHNRLENTFFGIYLRKSSHCIIANNIARGEAVKEMTSGNAIQLWYCDSILIEKNDVRKHRDGIYFEFVKNSIIRGNYSEGNVRYGLHFMFSDRNRYLNNTFENNGSGVAVMYGKEIEMDSNTFINNWGPASYGLLLKEITDGKITNNLFKRNTTAIFGEGATRMLINNNRFESNGWAMKVLSSCIENEVHDNDFESNSFSVFTNTPRNYNNFSRNYWSEYKGYDLDRDGFGDVPHRPVSLFTFIVEQCEPALLLMRSNFIALLEIAERAAPSITPENLVDEQPRMKPLW